MDAIPASNRPASRFAFRRATALREVLLEDFGGLLLALLSGEDLFLAVCERCRALAIVRRERTVTVAIMIQRARSQPVSATVVILCFELTSYNKILSIFHTWVQRA